MSFSIRLLPQAASEFDEAADWYERQREGLGVAFTDQIRLQMDRIAAMPEAYPPVYRNIRKAVIRKFPYIILYQQEKTEIIVIAFFHTSRNPREWRSRL